MPADMDNKVEHNTIKTAFLSEANALVLQRVYRGHLGRRQYSLQTAVWEWLDGGERGHRTLARQSFKSKGKTTASKGLAAMRLLILENVRNTHATVDVNSDTREQQLAEAMYARLRLLSDYTEVLQPKRRPLRDHINKVVVLDDGVDIRLQSSVIPKRIQIRLKKLKQQESIRATAANKILNTEGQPADDVQDHWLELTSRADHDWGLLEASRTIATVGTISRPKSESMHTCALDASVWNMACASILPSDLKHKYTLACKSAQRIQSICRGHFARRLGLISAASRFHERKTIDLRRQQWHSEKQVEFIHSQRERRHGLASTMLRSFQAVQRQQRVAMFAMVCMNGLAINGGELVHPTLAIMDGALADGRRFSWEPSVLRSSALRLSSKQKGRFLVVAGVSDGNRSYMDGLHELCSFSAKNRTPSAHGTTIFEQQSNFSQLLDASLDQIQSDVGSLHALWRTDSGICCGIEGNWQEITWQGNCFGEDQLSELMDSRRWVWSEKLSKFPFYSDDSTVVVQLVNAKKQRPLVRIVPFTSRPDTSKPWFQKEPRPSIAGVLDMLQSLKQNRATCQQFDYFLLESLVSLFQFCQQTRQIASSGVPLVIDSMASEVLSCFPVMALHSRLHLDTIAADSHRQVCRASRTTAKFWAPHSVISAIPLQEAGLYGFKVLLAVCITLKIQTRVLMIQKVIRGHEGRTRFRAKFSAARMSRQSAHAACLQRAFKQHMSRKMLSNAAAVRIQSCFRSHLCLALFSRARHNLAACLQLTENDQVHLRDKGARRIQNVWLSHRVRQAYLFSNLPFQGLRCIHGCFHHGDSHHRNGSVNLAIQPVLKQFSSCGDAQETARLVMNLRIRKLLSKHLSQSSAAEDARFEREFRHLSRTDASHCATSIQAIARGYLQRSISKHRLYTEKNNLENQRMTIERQLHSSTICICRFFRFCLVRSRMKSFRVNIIAKQYIRTRDSAAKLIAACFRGHAGRGIARHLWTCKCVLKIQKSYRGHSARMQTASRRLISIRLAGQERRNKCATKLQSNWRRFLATRAVRYLMDQEYEHQHIEQEASSMKEQDLKTNNENNRRKTAGSFQTLSKTNVSADDESLPTHTVASVNSQRRERNTSRRIQRASSFIAESVTRVFSRRLTQRQVNLAAVSKRGSSACVLQRSWRSHKSRLVLTQTRAASEIEILERRFRRVIPGIIKMQKHFRLILLQRRFAFSLCMPFPPPFYHRTVGTEKMTNQSSKNLSVIKAIAILKRRAGRAAGVLRRSKAVQEVVKRVESKLHEGDLGSSPALPSSSDVSKFGIPGRNYVENPGAVSTNEESEAESLSPKASLREVATLLRQEDASVSRLHGLHSSFHRMAHKMFVAGATNTELDDLENELLLQSSFGIQKDQSNAQQYHYYSAASHSVHSSEVLDWLRKGANNMFDLEQSEINLIMQSIKENSKRINTSHTDALVTADKLLRQARRRLCLQDPSAAITLLRACEHTCSRVPWKVAVRWSSLYGVKGMQTQEFETMDAQKVDTVMQSSSNNTSTVPITQQNGPEMHSTVSNSVQERRDHISQDSDNDSEEEMSDKDVFDVSNHADKMLESKQMPARSKQFGLRKSLTVSVVPLNDGHSNAGVQATAVGARASTPFIKASNTEKNQRLSVAKQPALQGLMEHVPKSSEQNSNNAFLLPIVDHDSNTTNQAKLTAHRALSHFSNADTAVREGHTANDDSSLTTPAHLGKKYVKVHSDGSQSLQVKKNDNIIDYANDDEPDSPKHSAFDKSSRRVLEFDGSGTPVLPNSKKKEKPKLERQPSLFKALYSSPSQGDPAQGENRRASSILLTDKAKSGIRKDFKTPTGLRTPLRKFGMNLKDPSFQVPKPSTKQVHMITHNLHAHQQRRMSSFVSRVRATVTSTEDPRNLPVEQRTEAINGMVSADSTVPFDVKIKEDTIGQFSDSKMVRSEFEIMGPANDPNSVNDSSASHTSRSAQRKTQSVRRASIGGKPNIQVATSNSQNLLSYGRESTSAVSDVTSDSEQARWGPDGKLRFDAIVPAHVRAQCFLMNAQVSSSLGMHRTTLGFVASAATEVCQGSTIDEMDYILANMHHAVISLASDWSKAIEFMVQKLCPDHSYADEADQVEHSNLSQSSKDVEEDDKLQNVTTSMSAHSVQSPKTPGLLLASNTARRPNQSVQQYVDSIIQASVHSRLFDWAQSHEQAFKHTVIATNTLPMSLPTLASLSITDLAASFERIVDSGVEHARQLTVQLLSKLSLGPHLQSFLIILSSWIAEASTWCSLSFRYSNFLNDSLLGKSASASFFAFVIGSTDVLLRHWENVVHKISMASPSADPGSKFFRKWCAGMRSNIFVLACTARHNASSLLLSLGCRRHSFLLSQQALKFQDSSSRFHKLTKQPNVDGFWFDQPVSFMLKNAHTSRRHLMLCARYKAMTLGNIRFKINEECRSMRGIMMPEVMSFAEAQERFDGELSEAERFNNEIKNAKSTQSSVNGAQEVFAEKLLKPTSPSSPKSATPRNRSKSFSLRIQSITGHQNRTGFEQILKSQSKTRLHESAPTQANTADPLTPRKCIASQFTGSPKQGQTPRSLLNNRQMSLALMSEGMQQAGGPSSPSSQRSATPADNTDARSLELATVIAKSVSAAVELSPDRRRQMLQSPASRAQDRKHNAFEEDHELLRLFCMYSTSASQPWPYDTNESWITASLELTSSTRRCERLVAHGKILEAESIRLSNEQLISRINHVTNGYVAKCIQACQSMFPMASSKLWPACSSRSIQSWAANFTRTASSAVSAPELCFSQKALAIREMVELCHVSLEGFKKSALVADVLSPARRLAGRRRPSSAAPVKFRNSVETLPEYGDFLHGSVQKKSLGETVTIDRPSSRSGSKDLLTRPMSASSVVCAHISQDENQAVKEATPRSNTWRLELRGKLFRRDVHTSANKHHDPGQIDASIYSNKSTAITDSKLQDKQQIPIPGEILFSNEMLTFGPFGIINACSEGMVCAFQSIFNHLMAVELKEANPDQDFGRLFGMSEFPLNAAPNAQVEALGMVLQVHRPVLLTTSATARQESLLSTDVAGLQYARHLLELTALCAWRVWIKPLLFALKVIEICSQPSPMPHHSSYNPWSSSSKQHSAHSNATNMAYEQASVSACKAFATFHLLVGLYVRVCQSASVAEYQTADTSESGSHYVPKIPISDAVADSNLQDALHAALRKLNRMCLDTFKQESCTLNEYLQAPDLVVADQNSFDSRKAIVKTSLRGQIDLAACLSTIGFGMQLIGKVDEAMLSWETSSAMSLTFKENASRVRAPSEYATTAHGSTVDGSNVRQVIQEEGNHTHLIQMADVLESVNAFNSATGHKQ